MNIRSHIISFFGKACAACVGLLLLFYTVMALLSETSLEITNAIPFGQFMLLFLSGALLTGASYLLRLPFAQAINILLHFIASFILLFLTFILAGNLLVLNVGSILVFFVIFTVCYFAVFGLYRLGRYLFFPEERRKRTEKEKKAEAEYTKRF